MRNWNDIQQCMNDAVSVEGGFSGAKSYLVPLPGGEEVFVKTSAGGETESWVRKEISMYRFLEKNEYPHTPKLISYNEKKTAFALEACTERNGWCWGENWSVDRLNLTIKAIKRFHHLPIKMSDVSLFSEDDVNQTRNGWRALLNSKDRQKLLEEELKQVGAVHIMNNINFTLETKRSESYRFAKDTPVHYDLRADNACWNANLGQVKIIDWSWAQLGDARIELAALLAHVQKSGLNVPEDLVKKLDADALHWLAGFWFSTATKPTWSGAPKSLRISKLLTGVAALTLESRL